MGWIAEALETAYHKPILFFSSSFLSCYLLYYLFEVVKRPIVATRPKGKFSLFIDKHLPILKEKYWPTLWCLDARLQTIAAVSIRDAINPKLHYQREILTLKDGGEIALDSLSPNENPRTPTLIVLPGLASISASDYIRNLAIVARNNGLRVVVFNQRGQAGVPLKTPRTYCAAKYEDFMEVIDHVKNKYKEADLGAVGFSLGGLILGNYLSSPEGKKTPLTCGMIVSAPWDAHLSIESLGAPINYIFNWHLARCLKHILRKIRPALEGKVTFIDSKGFDECLKSKTIRDFDAGYTSKEFGFKDVDDYYDNVSIHKKIQNVVKTPVLCLNAADDPFQPIKGIPLEVANKMDNLAIVVTSHGGHVGFMEGFWPFHQNQYMIRLIVQYFRAMLMDGGLSMFPKE